MEHNLPLETDENITAQSICLHALGRSWTIYRPASLEDLWEQMTAALPAASPAARTATGAVRAARASSASHASHASSASHASHASRAAQSTWASADFAEDFNCRNKHGRGQHNLARALNQAFEEDDRIPYWTEIWPAGIALAEWLGEQRKKIENRVCLDLGCGLGFTALAGAWLGAKVLAMDYEYQALYYAALNGCALEKNQLQRPDQSLEECSPQSLKENPAQSPSQLPGQSPSQLPGQGLPPRLHPCPQQANKYSAGENSAGESHSDENYSDEASLRGATIGNAPIGNASAGESSMGKPPAGNCPTTWRTPVWLAADWRRPCFKPGSIELIWAGDIMYEHRFIAPVANFLEHALAKNGVVWVAEPGRNIYPEFAKTMQNRGWQVHIAGRRQARLPQSQAPLVNVQIWQLQRKT